MKKLFLLLIIFNFFSCTEEEFNDYPRSIEAILIGQNSLYGSGSEGIHKSNQIITNELDWQNLILQMDSNNNVSSNFSETTIDFDEFIIIAIFDQTRGSGGNSIFITQIKEYERNIVVSIESLQNGINAVITQPFYIAKIPKSDKQIIFEES